MPGFVRRNAPTISVSLAIFGASRYLKLPKDAAKLISIGYFGYNSEIYDFEIVTPLLLTPFYLSLNHRLGLGPWSWKVLYAVAMGYVVVQDMHSPHAVPRNFQKWLEYHSGSKKQMFVEFKRDCSMHQWVTKQVTNSYSANDAFIRSFKRLAITLVRFQLFTMLIKMVLSRSFKLNANIIKQNMIAMVRSHSCAFVIMVMTGGATDQYNKLVHYVVKSDDIVQYRPSKGFQYAMYSICAFIGIQIASNSKQRILAAFAMIQAMVTRLNMEGLNIKAFWPIVCCLFSRY